MLLSNRLVLDSKSDNIFADKTQIAWRNDKGDQSE